MMAGNTVVGACVHVQLQLFTLCERVWNDLQYRS